MKLHRIIVTGLIFALHTVPSSMADCRAGRCRAVWSGIVPGNGAGAEEFKVRSLSSELILFRSPDPSNVYLATPGLAVLPNGRIVATFHVSGKKEEYSKLPGVQEGGRCFIFTSDDGGETWVHRANTGMFHARPFVAGSRVYVIGHHGDLRITRSDDWGDTWSEYSSLTQGEYWGGSGNNVLVRDGKIYLILDRQLHRITSAWAVSEFAPHVLRGSVDADLLERENWAFSDVKAFIDYFDDRNMETLFGIPFYPSFYPDRSFAPGTRRSASPVGWLEGNIVQINDPAHYLHDPSGKTFHLFMRSNTGLTNIGSILKVVEHPDGSMTTHIEKAPSGKDLVFTPIPGGHQTFYIQYDEPSGLYWMLTTQTTDSMTRGELLGSDRFGMAYDERRRLALYFSKNLFDWCFAGLAAMGNLEKEARHCVSMAIDGDDIIFLSRSGDEQAQSAHNCNLITFHRIKKFRSLAY